MKMTTELPEQSKTSVNSQDADISFVSDLLLAKRHLYYLLINKDGGGSKSNLTDVEIEIMYQLSLDHQIQEYLSNNR